MASVKIMPTSPAFALPSGKKAEMLAMNDIVSRAAAELSIDNYVSVCFSRGYVTFFIGKYLDDEVIHPLLITSSDDNFETRLEFLIKHGYNP